MNRVALFAVAGESVDAVYPLLAQVDAALRDPTATVGQVDEARREAFAAVRSRSCRSCAVPVEAWQALVGSTGEWAVELGGHLIPPARYGALAGLQGPSAPLAT